MIEQVLNDVMPWSSRKEFQKKKSKVFVDFSETNGDIAYPLGFLKGVWNPFININKI
jgi:hypothetical protein